MYLVFGLNVWLHNTYLLLNTVQFNPILFWTLQPHKHRVYSVFGLNVWLHNNTYLLINTVQFNPWDFTEWARFLLQLSWGLISGKEGLCSTLPLSFPKQQCTLNKTHCSHMSTPLYVYYHNCMKSPLDAVAQTTDGSVCTKNA
jgi:hypothetical protein